MVALVYGPDAGLVQERAEKLLKTRDARPHRSLQCRVDLNEAVLLADPARLADEAAAMSMMGGRRVVRVRGAGNDLAELFESFLDDPKGDALVVIEAGDLAKTSGAAQDVRRPQDRGRGAMLSRFRARPGRCGARCAARRRPAHRARCAGRCGVAAGLGPRRDAARDRKAGALHARPQAGDAGRCARRDGRRGRSAQRIAPATPPAAATWPSWTASWNGCGPPTPSRPR